MIPTIGFFVFLILGIGWMRGRSENHINIEDKYFD